MIALLLAGLLATASAQEAPEVDEEAAVVEVVALSLIHI